MKSHHLGFYDEKCDIIFTLQLLLNALHFALLAFSPMLLQAAFLKSQATEHNSPHPIPENSEICDLGFATKALLRHYQGLKIKKLEN